MKAVEISLEGPEPVITGFARVEVAPESDRVECLAELFNKGRFKSKHVVTSVSGQSVVVRYVTMPRMMMFWAKTKMMKVGMAAMISEA